MRPFEGIRILDLTHVFAGPFCTFQLAVMGAEVIKIESPDAPDMMRDEGNFDDLNELGLSNFYICQNSEKKSLSLDLKVEKDKIFFLKLLETADVLVQNYSGNSIADLGLSYKKLKKINPQRYLGDTPFEDFCKSAMQANGNNFFHSSINSKFLVDVVVPIEYLGHLSEYLESTLGQDLLIPTRNKSPGRTKNYTDEYFSLGNKLLATASYEFQKSVLIYEHIRDTYKTINYKQVIKN